MLKVTAPGGAGEILLHACCAPCSGAILECLRDSGIRPVVFFSNSNIFPKGEYDLRLAELRRYAALMGVELVEDAYDHDAWLAAVRGLEAEPERGRRCAACFRFRLARAARYAASRGLPVLATTLASSRWKDLGQVAEAGQSACSALPLQRSKVAPLQNFALRAHPSQPDGWAPPVYEATGGHGFAGENLAAASRQFERSAAADSTSRAIAGEDQVVVFWPQNWRKGGLQERRGEIVREQGFYNQNWCGCEFSKPQTL